MAGDAKREFDSGGKLLLWHGWTDGLMPAQNTIDYYESVLKTTGASRSRGLFMAPGVDHCSGGDGTFVIDALGALDTWVEDEKARASPASRRAEPRISGTPLALVHV